MFPVSETRRSRCCGSFVVLRLQLQRANFQKLLKPPLTELPSDTGMAKATKGSQRVKAATVHGHLTGPELCSKGLRPFLICRPDCSGQPIGCAIGNTQSFGLIAVGNHAQHGTEYFFLSDCAVRIYIAKDGCLYKVSLVQTVRRIRTAGHQGCAFGNTEPDVIHYPVPLLRGGDRKSVV